MIAPTDPGPDPTDPGPVPTRTGPDPADPGPDSANPQRDLAAARIAPADPQPNAPAVPGRDPAEPLPAAAIPELDPATGARLLEAARRAALRAYCPYSRFPVGAAALTAEGEIFDGCNVENASYGLTICAERAAIFRAVAATASGRPRLRAMLVYTPTPTPTAPCGACRQVIREFGPDCLVVSCCEGPAVMRRSLPQLLPDAFGPEDLEL